MDKAWRWKAVYKGDAFVPGGTCRGTHCLFWVFERTDEPLHISFHKFGSGTDVTTAITVIDSTDKRPIITQSNYV